MPPARPMPPAHGDRNMGFDNSDKPCNSFNNYSTGLSRTWFLRSPHLIDDSPIKNHTFIDDFSYGDGSSYTISLGKSAHPLPSYMLLIKVASGSGFDENSHMHGTKHVFLVSNLKTRAQMVQPQNCRQFEIGRLATCSRSVNTWLQT